MYSIVLMAALSTGAAEPGCHWRCGCGGWSAGHGCYGACYGGCYGGYAGACYGYAACYGYYSCVGCLGGYCMGGGATNYAPAIIAPAPGAPAPKPEAVPKPKGPGKDEASLSDDRARLTILVPADATIYIDGKPMQTSAAKRVFRTPKLDPKLTYYYDVKAEVVRDGETISRSQRVIVRAGEQVRAVFADLPVAKGEVTASAAR